MFAKACVLLVLVAAVSAQNVVTTRPCAGGVPQPVLFTSDECTAAGVCTLRRNQVFTGEATFDVVDQVISAEVVIQATLLGLNFPMPIPEGYETVCNFLLGGSTCPLAPGSRHIWGIQFPIQNILPAVSGVNIESKFQIT